MGRSSYLALAVLGLAACRGSQSALDPAGPHAVRIYELWNVMLVGGTVVFLVVTALVMLAVALPRRQPNERHRLRWVLAGVVTTIAILLALLGYNAITAQALSAHASNPVEVRIVARQWWWDITYLGDGPSERVRTANELVIPVGRPVRLTLESYDVIHSFWVPNLHGKRDVIPGRTNQIWIQADVAGTYRGQCAEFCGLQHAKMAMHVIAVPELAFHIWLANQRRPAAPPEDALARLGQETFLEICAKCHAIRGTTASATVAPDLTHIASRQTIAAATLPLRRGHLGGWILDPHQAKPGVFMPPVDLEADQLHAMLRYLEGLR